MFNAQEPVAYLWRDALQHAGCTTTNGLPLTEEGAPAPIIVPVPVATADAVQASDLPSQ